MSTDPNPPANVPDTPGTSVPEVPGNGGTPNANGGAADIAAAAGMSLEAINQLTGRQYKTLEDAQKGIQETYRFVGAKPREITPPSNPTPAPVVPENLVTREEFETANFLRDNPEHNKHAKLLQQLAKANNMSIKEIATGDPKTNAVAGFYQETVEKLRVADEAANTRSALTSNPRLGVIRDASSKALEAFEQSQKARSSGDVLTADRLQRQAESDALSAVISAFKMEGDTIVD